MTSEIAAMLDELMGRNRNLESGKTSDKVSFHDSEVCHFYLCGFCPHELFVNTRADLGPCKKIHDEAIRKEYQMSNEVFKLGYEDRFFEFMQDCIIEVERRIKRNRQRLDQNKDEDSVVNPETAETANRLSVLSIEITNHLLQIEQLGEKGEVAAAMTKTQEVEKLKDEREKIRMSARIQREPTNSYTGLQEKQMEVCEICGSFLIVGDAQARVDDHLMGKQHMGYARIRAKISELKDIFDKKRAKERVDKKAEKTASDDKKEKSADMEKDVKTEPRSERSSERRDSRASDRSQSDRQSDRHSDRRVSVKDERKSSRYDDRDRDRKRDRESGRRDERRDDRSDRRRSKDRSERDRGDRDKGERRGSKHEHKDRSRDKDRRKRSRSRSHKKESSRLSSKERRRENGRSGKENGERTKS